VDLWDGTVGTPSVPVDGPQTPQTPLFSARTPSTILDAASRLAMLSPVKVFKEACRKFLPHPSHQFIVMKHFEIKHASSANSKYYILLEAVISLM
jgi:hypothetical protein